MSADVTKNTFSKVNQKLYRSISNIKKKPAVNFLKRRLYDQKAIKGAIKKDPVGWFTAYHFHWGMAVRNMLRHEGFGEKYFGIKNLDDVYVELVEEAVMEKAQ